MKDIHLARKLVLDADYVGGGTFALLAKKGAGKTYTARVMAEEFWAANVPFVFMDPMGAAWGLRSSAGGESEGIPVAIFGGQHGDAPLERGGGALMADLVVEEGLSMVLDMSELGSRAAERQFALDFFDRLYRTNSKLVHLLVDEADLFAPQKPQAGDRQLLGMTENIVRRGRNKGIGITLITQRPAVLNKDVLTQVDGLCAMRIVGLTDREAIDRWVEGHGDTVAAAKVKGTLAGLENGECWWWIPELDILDRVQIRKARTFDSSPTRTRGAAGREPTAYSDVDMQAIKVKMGAQIERAKQNDPKALRDRVAVLERELEERPENVITETQFQDREVPVFDASVMAGIEHTLQEATAAAADLRSTVDDVATFVREQLAEVNERFGQQNGGQKPPVSVTQAADAARTRPVVPAPDPARRRPLAPKPPADGVTPAKQRILNALAVLEGIGVTAAHKTQLALFAQASPKSSGYANNLGALRSQGLVDYPMGAHVALTAEGRAVADPVGAPSTTEEMHAYVRQLVGPAKGKIVDALIRVYPDDLPRDSLAAAAGASPASSGFANNLGSLRSLGLIDYPSGGMVVATPVLFL